MAKTLEKVIMKAMGSTDHEFTVTGRTPVTENYLRLHVDVGDLFDAHPPHPTQWVRLWIPRGDGRTHQRGYTLINQDPEAGTADIEFSLHAGSASTWARQAEPGETIGVSFLGSSFSLPVSPPSEFFLFGDTASLPAINSLLDAIGSAPAQVFLEWQRPEEVELPVHAGPKTTVEWIERVDDGRLMVEAAGAVSCSPHAYVWAAVDARTTRQIAKIFRNDHGVPKSAVTATGYWK